MFRYTNISNIFWDWNGTLLNDLEICLASINQLLGDRGLPLLTRESYLQVFDFPVKDYYQRIGFDFEKEPFEIPAHQFMDLYFSKLPSACLHRHVKQVLPLFREKNYTQYILSAAEEVNLKKALNHFGIADFFSGVAGLSNHYAHSKLDVGKALIEQHAIEPAKTCLIGDTLHDFEVACELGLKCVLVADGHQPVEKLEKAGVPVFRSLIELSNFF
jgi:phosphoglycolate phosphatase